MVLMPQVILEDPLREGLLALQVNADDDLVHALARLIQLLDKWNRAFNLTAIRDPEEMVTLHVLDSICVQPFLQGVSILDVGTGAGLPGLPLAMVDPQRQFTLLDSGGKKIRFVQHAIGELALKNVLVEQVRVENYQPADSFDTVLCRAFSTIGQFVRSCGRLVASGGRLVAMKGRSPDDELKNLPSGWRMSGLTAVEVPGLDAQRHIVVLERT
jgi:16S rRNA (guanine527-N7)-methyltransferase